MYAELVLTNDDARRVAEFIRGRLRKPNAKTVAAMEAARRGEAVKIGNGTIEELFAELKSDDAQKSTETLHLLRSPANAEALTESIIDLEAGRGISGRVQQRGLKGGAAAVAVLGWM
jgi:hypothetical protein